MIEYSTNEAFRKLFLQENCTQIEMGLRIGSDKNSVHDWLKNKNQLNFKKLEEITTKLGKKITIKIETL